MHTVTHLFSVQSVLPCTAPSPAFQTTGNCLAQDSCSPVYHISLLLCPSASRAHHHHLNPLPAPVQGNHAITLHPLSVHLIIFNPTHFQSLFQTLASLLVHTTTLRPHFDRKPVYSNHGRIRFHTRKSRFSFNKRPSIILSIPGDQSAPFLTTLVAMRFYLSVRNVEQQEFKCMRGGFAVPGTPARIALLRKKQQPSQPDVIDPQTGFVKPATPPRSGLGSRRRHFQAEIAAEFPTVDSMIAFDRLHLKPITIATERNHTIARRLWIEWFMQYYSSSQKAEETLTKDAALPLWLKYFHSRNIRRNWLVSPHDPHLCRTHFRGGLTSIQAVLESAHKDKLLPTQKKPKRMLVETDLVEFLATTRKHTVQIASNFMRIQMNALTGFLYTHGFRPGCVVDAGGYEGRGEHLKCKGQRFDESLNVSTSMRNLGRSKAHIDSQLMLEALAITLDVFEENLLELRAKDPKTLTFPIRLHIEPHALELPVFRNANKTDSLTYSAAAHLLTKIKKFCVSDGGQIVRGILNVSKVHLRYLMGHTRGSKLSTITYQVPDRVADVSGTRFDEENTSFAAMAQMHSSVSWNRPTAPPDDKVKNDIGMKKLVTELSRRQNNFESKFGTGKTAQELFQDGNTDQLVVDVLEITAETLEDYMSLSAGCTNCCVVKLRKLNLEQLNLVRKVTGALLSRLLTHPWYSA
ncbi:hypothetical protein K438DRAFT_1776614 [Mycena galopus ATCC 62051]|nr:hypothetical protein K438DRAFT_1776614 [Mycena galopus ATCC 62051]